MTSNYKIFNTSLWIKAVSVANFNDNLKIKLSLDFQLRRHENFQAEQLLTNLNVLGVNALESTTGKF